MHNYACIICAQSFMHSATIGIHNVGCMCSYRHNLAYLSASLSSLPLSAESILALTPPV